MLAWCSEFSEMIDALKNLGFEGNMFVSTRTQALKTCEDILKLNLDIEMQIIVMFLSSQVARPNPNAVPGEMCAELCSRRP